MMDIDDENSDDGGGGREGSKREDMLWREPHDQDPMRQKAILLRLKYLQDRYSHGVVRYVDDDFVEAEELNDIFLDYGVLQCAYRGGNTVYQIKRLPHPHECAPGEFGT